MNDVEYNNRKQRLPTIQTKNQNKKQWITIQHCDSKWWLLVCFLIKIDHQEGYIIIEEEDKTKNQQRDGATKDIIPQTRYIGLYKKCHENDGEQSKNEDDPNEDIQIKVNDNKTNKTKNATKLYCTTHDWWRIQ